MTHKFRNKQLQRIKKKYKNLAAIVAAATILSTAMLPGMPAATAHASASSNADNLSATTSQGIGKTDQSSSQINFNSSVTPTKEIQKENKNSEATQKNTEKAETNTKTPAATAKSAEKVQSEHKIPETAPKATEQIKPIPTPKTPAPETPAPETPAPETPAPETPAPETPAPETPAPETPAPETPAPETPAPETPAPETPAPETPAPETPAPETPAPETPAPEIPAPETPAPPAHTENTSSPNTPPANYKQVLDISATAYAPGPHDNGQWGNKTHIGSQVRPGIIAVDPKVIPLGSRVYIEYPDGHGEYAIAEDTGGAIKGNRVDIAKWTVNEAKDFGIQKVKVYVVSTPEKV